jgi:hypothetical protein
MGSRATGTKGLSAGGWEADGPLGRLREDGGCGKGDAFAGDCSCFLALREPVLDPNAVCPAVIGEGGSVLHGTVTTVDPLAERDPI